MSNKTHTGYVQDEFDTDIDNELPVNAFYFFLGLSTILSVFFIIKTKQKLIRIKAKESYCKISILILYVSGINLVL